MVKRNASRYKLKAEIAKALAHPSRLLIIDALKDGEKCVCELVKLVGSDTSTVSRHLSILKNTGIVGGRKEGSNIYYKLLCNCVIDFFACAEKVIKVSIKNRFGLDI